MFGLFGSQGLIEKLLDGNGKAKKLHSADMEARRASSRVQKVLEEAGMHTARLTEHVVEMLIDDDDSIDIEEIRAEVDREIACKLRASAPTAEDCAECDDEDCEHRVESKK